MLIVLVLFSVSSLTNDWQHERICEPIVNRSRPCLSTEGRFANLRHLRRLLHSAFQAVGNEPVIELVIEAVKHFFWNIELVPLAFMGKGIGNHIRTVCAILGIVNWRSLMLC